MLNKRFNGEPTAITDVGSPLNTWLTSHLNLNKAANLIGLID